MDTRSNRNPAVGYVVSAWPRLSETFILNEVIAVERLGIPLRIFSVKNPKNEPVHGKVAQVLAPLTSLSIGSNRKAVWRANLLLFCGRPARYCGTLLRAVRSRRRVVLRRFFQAGYLADIVSREPVAHLHAHFANDPALVVMFAHQLTGIPYTFTAHAKDIYVKTPPELLRAEAQQAQAVVTCTQYNREYLARQLGPALDGKLHCIYHGLDLSQFKFRWPTACDPESPLILSVARLVEKKGLRDLLAAAAILRQRGRSFRIEIIGDGPLRQTLEAQVFELGLEDRITFLGAQNHEAVLLAYGRAAVFALPCAIALDGDRDGIPNVLLEAMASGTPVVSTCVSGIPELIHPEREGLLVPPNSPTALANALERLLTSPKLAESLAQAARAKVEEGFSSDRNSARLLALFQHRGTDENSVPLH